jgi:hypothetical protein
MSPGDRAAQLNPQARGSLFVVFYDCHGYGGGIVTHLHTGKIAGIVPNIEERRFPYPSKTLEVI